MQPPSSRQEKNKKILAYDGTYVTDFNYHSIDSIVQDAKKVAKESVNMLIKLINDPAIANTLVPADTFPVRTATLFVATIPVPASPSGGHIGILD